MPAKVIVKSGYIKNVQHMRNALDYAGNKIEAQLAVLSDGSAVDLGASDKISDSDAVQSVRIRLANGTTKTLTPERYAKYVREKSQAAQDEVIVWEGGEKQFSSAEYLKYIAYRPSVETAPGKRHGLFSIAGDADIDTEKQKLAQCKDCLMWSHIVSLGRVDAQRTGYDHRAAWQNLITAKSAEIAKLYNIDPKNLQLNAAYHDKDDHPHVHLFFYSTDPREGIVRDMSYASSRLKSLFFNEIFKDDVSYLKAVHYDQRSQLDDRLRGMLKGINRQSYRPPQELCDKLLALSAELRDVKGKVLYAYQKPQIKEKTDEIVQLMVEKDPHMREIFGAYAQTQQEFVEQYNEQQDKISKRMDEFHAHFFHPRAAQYGKPGSGDRAVLHNEVLRFAATLSEAVFLPPKIEETQTFEPISTRKTAFHRSSEETAPATGGETAKKEKDDTALDQMNQMLYSVMRDSLKDAELDAGAMGQTLSDIYGTIADHEFWNAYTYVPYGAKLDVQSVLKNMLEDEPAFQGLFEQHVAELMEAAPPDITSEQLEKKLLAPSSYDDKRMQDTIVRFSKKLEHHRAIAQYNTAVFFSLPQTFGESGDKELLAKLHEIGKMAENIPVEDFGYHKLDRAAQSKIDDALAAVLNSKKEIVMPDAVKENFLKPDDLTPMGFHNTIAKFAKKLEQHQAVSAHSFEVHRVLSDSFGNKDDALLPILEEIQQLTKDIAPDQLSYYRLDDKLRSKTTDALREVLSGKKTIDIPTKYKEEFLQPDALTPMGFHNTIAKFAKKLEEHKAVSDYNSAVFFALSGALDEDGGELLPKLQALSALLEAVPIDALGYRKLDEATQAKVTDLLSAVLNSTEEIKLSEERKAALLHPDDLTPIGLQNTVVRFSKKLDEHKAVSDYNSAVFFALSGALDEDGGELLPKLQALSALLEAVPIDSLGYRKLDEATQAAVADLLSVVLSSTEEMELPEELKTALLHPDDLTPIGLQNTVVRFAKKLEEHKAVSDYNSAVFFALSGALDEDGGELLPKLQALSALLEAVPIDALGYRKLDVATQAAVADLLSAVLSGTEEMELSEELKTALLHPDDLTPIGLQNTVVRFAKKLEEHKAVSEYNSAVFFALSGALDEDGGELLPKLQALSALLEAVPIDALGYRKLDEAVQEKVTDLLSSVLNGTEEMELSEELKIALLHPDDLTPIGLQNTVVRFAKKLEEHKAVSDYNSAVFFTLSGALDEDGGELMPKLQALSALLEAVPIDALGYRKLDEAVQAAVTDLLSVVLNSTEEMELSEELKTALLHPDDLTPIGLQNTVVRFAKKLEEHKAVSDYNSAVFFALSGALDEDGGELLPKLQALSTLLEAVPIDSLGYRKLDEATQAKVTDLLSAVLNSTEEMELSEELKTALLHPDDLTPIGLQNTVVRFAKKLEEHKAVSDYNSAVFFALSGALDEDGGELLPKLEALSALLEAVPIDALGYRKLDESAQAAVADLLSVVLNSTEEMELSEELKTALLHPDDLTPIGLQNTVVRFAKHLEEHKTIHLLTHDVFMGLVGTIEKKSPLHKDLLALQAGLKKVGADLPYSKLPDELQRQVTSILEALLRDHPLAKEKQNAVYCILHPDKDTPIGLHGTVLKFAANYDHYIKQNLQNKVRYTAQLMLRACARELGGMAHENDRYNEQGGKGQRSNITDRRNPQEVWRNYTEAYDFD